MSNLQIVKLSSGEELLGKVSDLELDGRQLIQIEQPAVVMIQSHPTEEGKFNVALAPYAPYADKNLVSIMPQHVVALMAPVNNIIEEYNRIYSKIAMPKEKKIELAK
tara:strand:+ start:143 stop:463 length:321 start_codon:yes stop_codon:yes gene_type:complete